MPLSEFQQRVFRLLAANRSPDSFVAGASVIHASVGSPRFSKDIDINHDTALSVALCAEADAGVLDANGFEVRWAVRQPMFQRANVAADGQATRLEWIFDSAFRFFPVEADPLVGYRLNFWDAATNKVLALVGRLEPRDFLDVIYLHENYLSLGAMAWAAAGKDAGLNPSFILEEAARTAHYRAEDFDGLNLVRPIDPAALQQTWRQALSKGRELVLGLPAEEVGCLYLDTSEHPVEPDPTSAAWEALRRHFGTVKGAWPIARE